MGVEIFVDGVAVMVPGDDNLLAGCVKAGVDLPYFCWHPAMGSVGACRQCAVKVDDRIVMACMTPVTAGMRVGVAEAEAAAAREGVVEFVLANHPHDCPVCEVGGECHLQDMTAMTGHFARRDRFAKRTHRSQDLGPFVKHEMNRCIGCYRCVRFYQDVAGGEDFGVFGSAKNVFFGRAEDGALESPFAGNLVEVCPTGVFVDKPFSARFRRKWDMRATPSVCPHCAVGCNISVQERDGVFRRVVNRFNASLNGYFLCDRGRFGVGFLEAPERLRVSRDRYGKALGRDAVVGHVAKILASGKVVGVGSVRASVEGNFALRRLVGVANFYAGVAGHEAGVMRAAVAAMGSVRVATLAEAERADAILVLGQDPLVVAPRLGLALRQAAVRPDDALLAEREIPAWHDAAARTAMRGRKNKVFVVGPAETGLDAVAQLVVRMGGDETAAFALEVARLEAGEISDGLLAAQNPVVVAGGGEAMVLAGARIVAALMDRGVDARFLGLVPAANSVGLACLEAESAGGCAVEGAHLLVLENDFFGGRGLETAASVTCLDHIETATARAADYAVAVGSFADTDGMFVNLEGRVQPFIRASFGEADAPAAWEILRDAGIRAGILAPGTWPDRAALVGEMAVELPFLAPCLQALPVMGEPKPPGLPHRFSGRTAARAHVDVREGRPPVRVESPYGTTMEGAVQEGAEPLVWAPGWNSGQAVLRLAEEKPEVFLFAEKKAGGLEMPEKPWRYEAGHDIEEMSALSPAIIARGWA
jgi:NADH-quinone oxidoreductase subunit G